MRIRREDCICITVDIQKKLVPVMHDPLELLKQCTKLLKGMRVLGIPVVVIEQYPKGLGRTVEPIAELLGEQQKYIEKRVFSIAAEPEVQEILRKTEKNTLILLGIETHVCILQSVLDLQQQGYQCVLAVDALSSRKVLDRDVAIERMRRAGAILTTTESLLFELLESSSKPEFKEISKLVK
jgi:nicotinamidase-related amidase